MSAPYPTLTKSACPECGHDRWTKVWTCAGCGATAKHVYSKPELAERPEPATPDGWIHACIYSGGPATTWPPQGTIEEAFYCGACAPRIRAAVLQPRSLAPT